MATVPVPSQPVSTTQPLTTHPYTCTTCELAFSDPVTHRAHHSSDLHRYNAKRKITGLPAVTDEVYQNVVVKAKKEEDDEDGEKRREVREECVVCGKSFSSNNALQSHLRSKKHQTKLIRSIADSFSPIATAAKAKAPAKAVEKAASISLDQETSANLDELIQHRLRVSPPILPLRCLFCDATASSEPRTKFVLPDETPKAASVPLPSTEDPSSFPDPKSLFAHMLRAHGFFTPDQEYLADPIGLLTRLGEEVGTWNICLWCGSSFGGDLAGTGERQGGLEKVRRHMIAKDHCKLPWDTVSERLLYSDYYDYRSSYPDFAERQAHRRTQTKDSIASLDSGRFSAWEEVDDDTEESVVIVSSSSEDETEEETLEEEDEDDMELKYGDSKFELVLPSGARIAHRSVKKKHVSKQFQNAGPTAVEADKHQEARARDKAVPSEPDLALALINAKIDDSEEEAGRKRGARTGLEVVMADWMRKEGYVSSRGGGGTFGKGLDVVKARNAGEAREAARPMREVRDFRKRLEYDTKRFNMKRNNKARHFHNPDTPELSR